MKNVSLKIVFGLTTLLTSIFLGYLIIEGGLAEAYGTSAIIGGLGSLVLFWIFLSKFSKRLPYNAIFYAGLITFSIIILLLSPNMNFLSKIAPSIIVVLLGIISAHFLVKHEGLKKYAPSVLLVVFMLVLNLGLYDLWVHKI